MYAGKMSDAREDGVVVGGACRGDNHPEINDYRIVGLSNLIINGYQWQWFFNG
jgi:hypothetical protein